MTSTTDRRRERVARALGAPVAPHSDENVAALAAMLTRHAASLSTASNAEDIAADALERVLTADPASPVGRMLADYAGDHRGRAVAYGRQVVRTIAATERRAATVDPVRAAIDADGPSERPDRDDNGCRIRNAETFAGVMGEPGTRRPYADDDDAQDQADNRADAVRRARRPWETPRELHTIAPRSAGFDGGPVVRILRERSLEDMLAASRLPFGNRPGRDQVDAAGIHGAHGATDEADRYARRAFAAHLWHGAAPEPTSEPQRRIVEALSGTLGALLAEHCTVATPQARGKASPKSARWHAAQGRRAVRALGDDDAEVGQPIRRTAEHSRIGWTDALRALSLPTTATYVRALQSLAREHARNAATRARRTAWQHKGERYTLTPDHPDRCAVVAGKVWEGVTVGPVCTIRHGAGIPAAWRDAYDADAYRRQAGRGRRDRGQPLGVWADELEPEHTTAASLRTRVGRRSLVVQSLG